MRTRTQSPVVAVRALCCLLVSASLSALEGCNTTSGYSANRTGMAFYRRGNFMAARDEFRRAAIDAPYNADYRHNLAMATIRQGDIANAEQNYRQALELNPTHQPSYHGLAMLMNEQGRQAEADQLVQAYVDTQPYTPGAHVEMAWLKQQRGDYAAAERSLQQAIDIKPNHPVALAQLGQLYEQTGRPDRAAALYRQSLKGNWNQPGVKSRLASVQRTMPYSSQYAFAQNGSAMAAVPGYGPTQVRAQRVAWDYPLPTYENPGTSIASEPVFERTAAAPLPTAIDERVPFVPDEPAAEPVEAPSEPTETVPQTSESAAVPEPTMEAWEPVKTPSPQTNSPEDAIFDADPAHSTEAQ